jgi:hypothetical protein
MASEQAPRCAALPPKWLNADVVAERTRALAAEWDEYRTFCKMRVAALATVAREELGLRPACELLYHRALDACPHYLKRLQSFQIESVRKQIARYIVSHFQTLAEADSNLSALARGLEQEFSTIEN